MDIELQDWQWQFVDCAEPVRVLCCGRKSGKSWIVPIDMISRAEAGAKAILYATPSSDQLMEVWNRWEDPEFDHLVLHRRINPRQIILTTGTVILFKTCGSRDNLRGPKQDAIYLDECAFLDDSIRRILLPMLSVSKNPGQIYISTPNGEQGFFYDVFKSTPPSARWHIPSEQSPYVSKEFLDEMRQKLPANEFAQEYGARFIGSGSAAIPDTSKCVVDYYKMDPDENPLIAIGIDLGRHNDNTAFVTLDSAFQVRDVRLFNGLPWPEQVKKIVAYGSALHLPIIIDSTGVGDPIYEQVAQLYKNIHKFTFTQKSRVELFQGVISGLQQGRIKVHSKYTELIDEIKALQYIKSGLNWRYDHPPGGHDDILVALSLAYYFVSRNLQNRRLHTPVNY